MISSETLFKAKRASALIATTLGYVPRRLRLITSGYYHGAFRGKIFCIGRNKTGTTSLENLFRLLGYKVANQWRSERLIYEARFIPDGRFWRWVDSHQVFQDSPFNTHWLLPELIHRYPNARFILSVRARNEWLASLINHHAEHLNLTGSESPDAVRQAMLADSYVGPGYWYSAFTKNHPHAATIHPYDSASLLSDYDKYHKLVRTIIPVEQLLEIDISKEADSNKIVEFLGLPPSFNVAMPKLNQRRG